MAIYFQALGTGTSSSSSLCARVVFPASTVGFVGLAIISRDADVAPSSTPTGWTCVARYCSTYQSRVYVGIIPTARCTCWKWEANKKTLANGVAYGNVNKTTPIAAVCSCYVTASGCSIYAGCMTTSQQWIVLLASAYSTSSRTWNLPCGYVCRRDSGGSFPDFWQTIIDTNGTWCCGTSGPKMITSGADDSPICSSA